MCLCKNPEGRRHTECLLREPCCTCPARMASRKPGPAHLGICLLRIVRMLMRPATELRIRRGSRSTRWTRLRRRMSPVCTADTRKIQCDSSTCPCCIVYSPHCHSCCTILRDILYMRSHWTCRCSCQRHTARHRAGSRSASRLRTADSHQLIAHSCFPDIDRGGRQMPSYL